MVIIGSGTLITLIDPTFLDTLDQAINGFPGSGGGVAVNEFGALNTIAAPNPYVINSGTKIRTAPTITTAGITSQGKIYRGPAKDGPPADYLYGSTSAFDLGSGFTEMLADPTNLPLAVFKFNSLQLRGNPSIVVPPGGARKLALVSIGDLTSAPPGGTLTFAGINTLLTTQNGSITLTPDITFSNLQFLLFHARGATSNVTLGSPIMGVGTGTGCRGIGAGQCGCECYRLCLAARS